MTTRRRRFAGPLRAGAPAPSPAAEAEAPSPDEGFGAAFGLGSAAFGLAGACLVFVAVAPSPEPFRAARASDSSTLDCAALASTPAALSAARTSLLVRPWALAISCTRFF